MINLLHRKQYVWTGFDDSKVVIVTFTTNNNQSKKFEDEQLQALLEENPAQTLKELSQQLEVDKLTISQRLRTMERFRKKANGCHTN